MKIGNKNKKKGKKKKNFATDESEHQVRFFLLETIFKNYETYSQYCIKIFSHRNIAKCVNKEVK